MKSNRQTSRHLSPERHTAYFSSELPHHGAISSTVSSTCHQGDLGLHSWQWPVLEPGPSNQAFVDVAPNFTGLKQGCFRSQRRTSPTASQSTTKESPLVACDSEYLGNLQRSSSPPGDILPPLCCPTRWALNQLSPPIPAKTVVVGGNSPCNGPDTNDLQSEYEESLSPLDWQRKTLLASPFSEDSDSDDGLAPSPFSSPEFNASDDVDEEPRARSLYFLSPPQSDLPEYQQLDEYPSHHLYHDSPEDEQSELPPLSLSLSPLSISPTQLPHLSFDESSTTEWGPPNDIPGQRPAPLLSPVDHHHSLELGLQSPSVHSSSLPIFDFYPSSCYDTPLHILDSPHHQAADLPFIDNEPHFHSESLGLSSGSSTTEPSPISPLSCETDADHEFAIPSGYPQRTTWLSLPGADTDDDLIPADLASKNYIPDPSLAIPTTPPSRSLLIWDPTTRSGLPPGIPTYDGTGRPLSHRFFVNEAPLIRLPSPDENFEVDPCEVAELTKRDAEKGHEAQKLCELRQRTTVAAIAAAAMAASKSGNNERQGAQWEAERVKERWRELTALLRLKLKSQGKKNEVSSSQSSSQSNENALANAQALSSTGSTLTNPASAELRSSSLPTSTLAPILEFVDGTLSSSTSSSSSTLSSPATQSQRRSSKPKITSMAQLVANMVFQRQQEALRRTPSRSRTWPPPSAAPTTSGLGSKKLPSHATPKSPLRHMILPDDGETEPESTEGESDSPLQLSPLWLGMCQSPESLYGCLEAHSPNSLAGLEG
ncbi:hypothetical protein CPB83DRAFT_352927 [Crepidotus variabilis]|uniref:Uncharacterized protein n=1 Tax=Crepidotus variabilis TaxID=179855 RepID=A0A9P6JP95_9AGAR|nr:hypothetical protein CPB83DRAFT_352927 [Crepidotus variabilis]